MRANVACWVVVALGAVAAAPASAAQLTLVEDGLNAPIAVVGHPTDPAKLYAVERGGVVKLLEGGNATTVLDITPQVDDDGEGGLLSIALPDDYATSGRIYAYFTESPSSGTGNTLVIASYGAGSETPSGSAASRQDVLKIPHPGHDNHNGGTIHFGPDGNLWLATGDGGGSGDPGENAENPSSLLGKMLRITPTPGGGYTSPAGNPFADGGGRPEIWSTGLRNPFRWSFDRATGEIYIGDVGQSNVEEIDRAVSPGLGCGVSYGWDTFEGDALTPEGGPTPANYLPPLLVHYDDEEASTPYADDFRSITGGVVVRDPALDGDLTGRYLYTDYLRAGDHLFSADPATGVTRQESLTLDGVTGFGEDAWGRVYAASINTGSIHRVAPSAGPDIAAGAPARFPLAGCAPPADGTDDDGNGGGDGQQTQTPANTPTTTLPTIPFAPAALDVTPPVLSRTIASRQRLRNRSVLVRASCDEPCTLAATGKVLGRLSVRGVKRRLARGVRASLRLKLGPRGLAAIRRSRRPRIDIVLRATDAAGNVTRRTARVTVVD